MIIRHTFKPLNNARLSHLCGPLDEHLRRIEEALDVKVAHRHEQFKVEGAKAQAEQAMDVLQALYEIADHVIDPAVVGGLRVQIADDVIDGSISARLADLRQKLAG